MKPLLVAILFCLSTSFACAGESIQDLGAFEAQVNDCVSKWTKESRCMERVLGKHVLPSGDKDLLPVSKQLDAYISNWLDKSKVFAIHPISTKKTGDIFQTNTYIVEDDSGSLVIFSYSLLRRLGKWYVFSFLLNGNDNEIGALLKG